MANTFFIHFRYLCENYLIVFIFIKLLFQLTANYSKSLENMTMPNFNKIIIWKICMRETLCARTRIFTTMYAGYAVKSFRK